MGTAYSYLFVVPTGGPLEQVCKTVILPLLHLCGGNDLSYLNHTMIVHYNASYGCGKCLKQVFMSSSALHNHKKVCLGFAKKPTTGSDGKPSSGRGGDGNQGGGSTRVTPKKKDSKAPVTDSQGTSAPMALQTTPHHSRHKKSHCHKPHKDSKLKKDLWATGRRRRRMQIPLGRTLVTRHGKTVADVRLTSATVSLSHQDPCISSINYFCCKTYVSKHKNIKFGLAPINFAMNNETNM